MKQISKNSLEMGCVLLIFLATSLASHFLQAPITYNDGQSFDGVFYYRMAYQMSTGLPVSSEAPFVYRLGTPWLVSLFFREDLLIGFKVVNLVANLISVLLFPLWLRRYLGDWRVRVLLSGLFISQWHGPVRFTFYDPTYTDPWLFVFLLLGLIVLGAAPKKPAAWSTGWMSLLCFAGVFFREVTLLLPLALFFARNPMGNREMGGGPAKGRLFSILGRFYAPALAPLLAGLAGFVLTHLIARQYNDYSFFAAALDWGYEKPLPTYVHGWFVTYGLWIILPLAGWRRSARFLMANQPLAVVLAGFAVFGWIGGSDTERFLYWGMPVVYLLVGLFLEEAARERIPLWFILLMGAATLFSQRWLWTIPDFPNPDPTPTPILSIASSEFQYLDLWSYFSERSTAAVSLAQYLLLSAGLWAGLKWRRKPENEGG